MVISDAVTVEKSAQGSIVETQYLGDDKIFKTITLPNEPYARDYSQ